MCISIAKIVTVREEGVSKQDTMLILYLEKDIPSSELTSIDAISDCKRSHLIPSTREANNTVNHLNEAESRTTLRISQWSRSIMENQYHICPVTLKHANKPGIGVVWQKESAPDA